MSPLPTQAANKDLQGTLLQVQAQITDIGRSLYVGTTDLIHQVNDAIQEELHPHNNPVVRPIGKVASARCVWSVCGVCVGVCGWCMCGVFVVVPYLY